MRNGAFDPKRNNKSSVDRPKQWKRYLHGTLRNQTRNTILGWISRKDGQAWTREGFSRPESTITKHNGIEKNARKQRFPRGTSQGYIARRAIFYFLFLVKELRGRRGRALEKFLPSPARKPIKNEWKRIEKREKEMKTKRISAWKRWSTTRRENHCAQHTAKLTGADLADSVSFSNFRLVLAGDNAADGLLPSELSRRPLAARLFCRFQQSIS